MGGGRNKLLSHRISKKIHFSEGKPVEKNSAGALFKDTLLSSEREDKKPSQHLVESKPNFWIVKRVLCRCATTC